MQTVTALFHIISRMDLIIPQANINTPIKNKPRLAVTDDGQEHYPSALFSMSDWMPFGIGLKDFPAMGRHLQKCPENMIDAYKQGEILSFLCQYGIGNVFLKKAVETDTYPF